MFWGTHPDEGAYGRLRDSMKSTIREDAVTLEQLVGLRKTGDGFEADSRLGA